MFLPLMKITTKPQKVFQRTTAYYGQLLFLSLRQCF